MSKTEQPKTLFQRIADHEVPADIVFEDELCVAFRDVHPKAPIHVLVVPRKPIPSMADLTDDDQELMGHLWMRIRDVAAQLGLTSGYVPRFVKAYADLKTTITEAITRFRDDVRQSRFPGDEQTYQ